MNTGTALRGALGIAGFLLIAEALGRTGVVDPYAVPLASSVLSGAFGLLLDGEFLAGVGDTLFSAAAGLLLATAAAVPSGLVLGTFPRAERAVRPLVEFLRPIPSVALLPLALFALADQGKIALIVYTSYWSVLINTLYGLRDVDPLAKETLQSFGFGRYAVVRRVSLPSAAPFIATGVRIAASVALIVAVSVELVAGGDGIGTFVTDAASGNRRDLMIAATAWTGIIGLLVNSVLSGAERRAFRWHRVQVGEGAA
ncbi:ABC transporter permease [Planomonospora parontospora]|uniref:ABC transporter permease n=1 Tax=Planomonospora parontospora TaxID=58119 RepID=UPI00166FD34B|nr:ABC transporter permease subunit [Planomonospora parontospora]GGL31829.1 nitrate ABC transporter permease [Planomonospora parontospora subsp. antibiotica]GII16858.1 nitrate ABC transporter permease [Planomonospora parontospora subsp. antibiotica]